jgi:hypothetical protein
MGASASGPASISSQKQRKRRHSGSTGASQIPQSKRHQQGSDAAGDSDPHPAAAAEAAAAGGLPTAAGALPEDGAKPPEPQQPAPVLPSPAGAAAAAGAAPAAGAKATPSPDQQELLALYEAATPGTKLQMLTSSRVSALRPAWLVHWWFAAPSASGVAAAGNPTTVCTHPLCFHAQPPLVASPPPC